MRISVTEAGGEEPRHALVRELMHRFAHEIRNSENAAAVNLEVLRSRFARGAANDPDNAAFAERAAQGLEQTVVLTEAIFPLVAALLAAEGKGVLSSGSTDTSARDLTIPMDKGASDALLTSLIESAACIGTKVEEFDGGVILRIPLKGDADSKE